MKTSILLAFLIGLFFFQSCEKEEEKYERLIVGQWTTYSLFEDFLGNNGNDDIIYYFTENYYSVYYEDKNSSKGELIRGPFEYSIKGDSIYLNSVPRKIVGLSRQYVNMGGIKLSRCK